MFKYNFKCKGKIILMHDQNSQKSFGKLDVEVKNDELKKFFQKGCAKSFIPKNDNIDRIKNDLNVVKIYLPTYTRDIKAYQNISNLIK